MIGKSIGLSVKRIMTRNSPLLSYGVALLNVALALAVSLLLSSLIQPTPLALFYVAVMVSAWYGGLRPGLVATLLSTLVISYFIPPYNLLSIIHVGNVLRLGVFVLAALLISGLNQARRTALRQEQQLRAESETTHRRTAHLLEHMTDAFMALDRDWRIIYVNAEAERLNKKPRSTMVGKTHWEEWPASLGTQVEHQYRRAMTERIAVHFEHRYYAPPDYDVWLEIRAYPSEDGLGIFYRDISDRKRAEEDLRRSEAAFRTISNAAPALVWVCSPEGENIFFNDRWYEFTGQTKAEAVGLGWTETMHPDDAAQILPYWKRCQQTGEPYEGEVRYRRHDGEYRWHTFRALPRRNTDGDIKAWYGLSVDISDRKQAETALSESERRFRRLVESNMFGVAFGNFTGGIHYVNEYFLNMVGYTREEIETGQVKWTDITPPEFLPLDEQAMVELRTNGVATPFEKEYIRKDGTRVPILIGSALLQEPYNQQQEMIGFFVDLSDRKQAEEELRQKNAILNVINESTPTPIFVKDRQGRIIYANPATLKVLGKSAEEVIGFCDCDLYPNPEDAARVMENDRRIMETGQMEVVEESPDGIRTFLGIKVPYHNESGEVIGLIGISNDISERVQIERDREQVLQQEQAARQVAEEANRIKDEFLAVLSHELRSPLNPILGWTRLLQNGNLDAARQREALATIERNAKLQTQLIEDLLDISRIMQGKLTLTAAPVSLTFVISAAVETVRLAAAAKQIQILLDLSTGIAPVSGDAARLQQVVWNLLSNAVKFTPNGGQVIVELRQLDGLAQIRVIDTGKGISPDFLPYVFEYFRQADATTTRKFGGLGLGLAIVRQIVEMHGGTVEAESLGENQGATFTVQLPSIQQAISTVPEPTPAKAETTEAPLSNLQILLVDDDADTREFQAFLLEQSGAKVTAVASGLEALQALERSIPNVIVSDIGMAEMDGYMLMQEIRSHPDYRRRRIPAIALTAYARDFDQQKALQVGFQSHITKPVEPEALIEGILMLLRQPDFSLTQTTVDGHKKTLSDRFH